MSLHNCAHEGDSSVRDGDLLTAEEVINQFFAPAATDMIDTLIRLDG